MFLFYLFCMSIYISCTSACLEINLVLAIHEHVARGPIFWPSSSTTRPGWVRARSGLINHVVPGLGCRQCPRPGSARHKTVRTGSARCRGAGHKAQPPPSRPRLPVSHSHMASLALLLLTFHHSLIHGPPAASSPPRRHHCQMYSFFPFRVSHEVSFT